MENLAYLYILAEEDEQQEKNHTMHDREQQVPEKAHIATHRLTSIRTTPVVEGSKASLDCDRVYQSYPTLYL